MLGKVGKWYSEVFLYKASRWMVVLCAGGMLVSMMANVTMVAVRKPFAALGWHLGALIGAYEITQMMMVFMATCAIGYTWYTAGHIRIGLFRDNMKERTRNILDAISAFLAMLYVPVIVWVIYALFISNPNAFTLVSRIPIGPFQIIYCVVMTHLFLVLLRSFIGLASKAMGKQFAREPYLERQ
ncbi:TRAP transporter small permease subunit [Chloroflexota bacterium]